MSRNQRKQKRPAHSYPTTRDEQDDLDIFYNQFDKFNLSNEPVKQSEQNEECKHTDTVEKNGMQICCECGEHVYENIVLDQEWRYYGDSDNKNASDPSRCQYRKVADKGIRKDLEKLNLPNEVISIADAYYFQITNGDIKRGNLRKGIMFACVFEAYKDIKTPRTPEYLQELFGLDRKSMSKGLTYFCLRSTRKHKEYITAEHFIPKVIRQFEAKEELIAPIIQIYKKVENKSSLLSRSNPQSVSCGIVYYYFKKINLDITTTQFGKTVGLSDITVNRICNEIEEILDSPES
jgi:transcription initiation factor TFIIIB Brf1 subunit/transcription initiation factor TFIIB